MRPTPCLALSMLIFAAPVQSASVIETREGEAPEPSVMTVEGHLARMQNSPRQYVLVDTRKRSFLSVDLAAKHIIDMADMPQKPADVTVQKQQPVRAALSRVGRGPLIAGFPTEHYQLLAAGKICSNTYLSKKALQAAGMQEFMRGFAAFSAQQKAAYRDLGADFDPCEDAEQVAMERYPELGMPLKTVDVDGFLRQEVVRIRTGVTPPERFFEAPAGLKTLTLEQFLRQDVDAEKAVQELLEEQPQPPRQ